MLAGGCNLFRMQDLTAGNTARLTVLGACTCHGEAEAPHRQKPGGCGKLNMKL